MCEAREEGAEQGPLRTGLLSSLPASQAYRGTFACALSRTFCNSSSSWW